MLRAEGHDVGEEGDGNGALAGIGSVDVGVGVEWIAEEVEVGEELMHPLAAVDYRHHAGDDLTADDEGLACGLFHRADIFA